MLVEDNRLKLLADLHSETDLVKGCVPVCRQFGLVRVQSSLTSWKVEVDLVAPEFRIVMKGSLGIIGKKIAKSYIIWSTFALLFYLFTKFALSSINV